MKAMNQLCNLVNQLAEEQTDHSSMLKTITHLLVNKIQCLHSQISGMKQIAFQNQKQALA